MLVKLATNFQKDGQRIAVIGTNKIVKLTVTRNKWPCPGTINKPPLHEAYTVTFVEQPSCHSLDFCENRWYHLIDTQVKHSEHDPSPCEIIITILRFVLFDSIRCCLPLCSLNTACLLPPQRLKRTRGRFKCVPQRLTARTWLTIFLYRC